jgi:cystathionine beta-lyase/cystathionine gamma-synthase
MSSPNLFKAEDSGLLSLLAPVYVGAGQALVSDRQKSLFSESRYDGESFYFRDGLNPTVNHVESKIKRLYSVDNARLVQSGMAAINVAIISLIRPGCHIYVSSDCFVDTQLIALQHLRRWGINAQLFDLTESGQIPSSLNLHAGDIVIVESVSNPLCKVANLSHIEDRCRKANASLIIDNTIPSSLALPIRPADNLIVVESVTKYHLMNAAWGGVLLFDSKHKKQVHEVIKLFGYSMTPDTASKLEIGLQTLTLRLKRQCDSKAWIMNKLSQNTFTHVTLVNQASDPSPFLVLKFQTPYETTKALDSFETILPSPSFGGPQSMACIGNFHTTLETADLLKKRGVDGSILRISCGLEDAEQIWQDLQNALVRKEIA